MSALRLEPKLRQTVCVVQQRVKLVGSEARSTADVGLRSVGALNDGL